MATQHTNKTENKNNYVYVNQLKEEITLEEVSCRLEELEEILIGFEMMTHKSLEETLILVKKILEKLEQKK